MKTANKWLGILLALILVIVAGCQSAGNANNGGNGGNGAASGGDTPDKVTLRFSWWGSEDRHTALLDAINLYMEENPHVTIEPEYSGFDGYFQRLFTQYLRAEPLPI